MAIKDIFEARSRFEESSVLDQDDSYGNYRPKFEVKNHKVTGRSYDIMQLQRIASQDRPKALLGPIQPDLSGMKPEGKRLFVDNANNKSVNHIKHSMPEFQADGSPLPAEEHYFRKALDNFTHDGETDKVTDPQLMRLKILMEGSKQSPDVETKNKVST